MSTYNLLRNTINKLPRKTSTEIKEVIISICYPFFNIVYELKKLRKTHHNIAVKTYDETIKDMTDKSLIRFGDGEFVLIGGGDIYYQPYSKELADKLSTILLSNYDNLTICVPDIFDNLKNWDNKSRKFWSCFRTLRYTVLQNNTHPDEIYKYGSTNATRPYMGLPNNRKNLAKGYYNSLKKVWDNQDIVFIEGKTTRNGVGNDLYNNAKSIQRIICPHTDAYASYKKILTETLKLRKDVLILISLGPAGKVLGFELWRQGYHVLDLGHIDSDYEWYLQNANERVTYNNNKHTAECLDSEKIITDCTDEKYLQEIIGVID